MLLSDKLISCCAAGTNGCLDLRRHAFVLDGRVSAEWSRCLGSMPRRARGSVAPLRRSSAGWMPARMGRLSAGVRRRHPLTIRKVPQFARLQETMVGLLTPTKLKRSPQNKRRMDYGCEEGYPNQFLYSSQTTRRSWSKSLKSSEKIPFNQSNEKKRYKRPKSTKSVQGQRRQHVRRLSEEKSPDYHINQFFELP